MGEYADIVVDETLNGGHWMPEDWDEGWMGGHRRPRMGTSAPAGSPLARARMRAHHSFDRLWQSGKMSRTQAYKWLARKMKVPLSECHMIMFDEEQCAQVVKLTSLKMLEDE